MAHIKHLNKLIASIVISVLMLLLSIGIISYAFFIPELRITVVSDIHVMTEALIVDDGSPAFTKYDNNNQKMINISEAIFKSLIDSFIAGKEPILLIPGDLTDDGDKLSHQAVAGELARAEAAGKSVFVIPGNHDVCAHPNYYGGAEPVPVENVTPTDFEEIYSEFGYNEAISKDSGTLSYAADLNNGYRLIAIDSTTYSYEDGTVTKTDGVITPESLEWVQNQITTAIEEGMTPIAMMHYPVVNHLGSFLGGLSLAESSRIENSSAVLETLASSGLNYIFTGHMHAQDIATENGLYDIETCSLANYPAAYRKVSFYRQKTEIRSENLDAINQNYLPDYLDAVTAEAVLADFHEYASNYINKDNLDNLLEDINANTVYGLLSSLIEITPENQTAAENLAVDIFDNLVLDFVDMPLNAVPGQTSLESILAEYGLDMPETSHNSVLDLLMQCLKNHYRGDENITADSNEAILIEYCVLAAIYNAAEYGLFTKLNGLDPSIPAIDLMPAMPALFTSGRLDVEDNGLITAIIGLELIKDALPISLSGNARSMLSAAKIFLKGFDIMGMDLSPYIDPAEGDILLLALIDDEIIGYAAAELLSDPGPDDNNIVINLRTLEWKALD